ncbi:CesT family type III secretion system chaperone [Chromobacterium haemolyticum]|uniref:CesT family type III secretion system chaperone n=1 Tax=Chromobacterium haemolyticum TaxID=394935 RepID=A0ABS3GH77_9NEIS|nr:CesT family type III secretion system chaperone [Chromobacterium haemolyticum]MBK0413304.1 CesT family type III secretion system chaperone [Chromobacterium haemolyticum]MBO0414406.1 CesT family type III secretion system chaperone [Chromobacterium haemolyticum]MBO0497735.1 CesT family type III secretion system chaperone [Chromobacterium haemolyticum]BBH12678.1 hypothetical protein CH06BL_19260 [Chromobacterium haemolyticum]
MPGLIAFHRCVAGLLQHLGFDAPELAADQEVLSLQLEQRFSLHFVCLDQDSWFMQADLGDALPSPGPAVLAQALRRNQLALQAWQPVVSLDQDERLGCWLRLPCQGCDLPSMASALDAVIVCAEELLSAEDGLVAR